MTRPRQSPPVVPLDDMGYIVCPRCGGETKYGFDILDGDEQDCPNCGLRIALAVEEGGE